MNQPKLLPKPFAENGAKSVIPVDRSVSDAPEIADYDQGFPIITMTPLSAGGKAPRGTDFNGLLNDVTSNIGFLNKGGRYRFDDNFAADIGGYSKGAVLMSDAGDVEYLSLIDGNMVNFNTASVAAASAAWEICPLTASSLTANLYNSPQTIVASGTLSFKDANKITLVSPANKDIVLNFDMSGINAAAKNDQQSYRFVFKRVDTSINSCTVRLPAGMGLIKSGQMVAIGGSTPTDVDLAETLDFTYDPTTNTVIETLVVSHGYQKFTEKGMFIVPRTGTYYITMCGGGGGGAGGAGNNNSMTNIGYNYGGGGGGGAAAYHKQIIRLTGGQPIEVTIGAGGIAGAGATGATFNSGTAGGTTNFGTVQCGGGGGGVITFGSASGGDPGGEGGQMGGTGFTLAGGGPTTPALDGYGGAGGDCLLGAGAKNGHSTGSPCGYGSGGAGGRSYYTGGLSGSNGAPGVVIVEW